MSHLSVEDLARLVDEAPAGEEAEHLRGCVACRDELEELRRQTNALAELPREWAPPPRGWTAIEDRLRAEGLVHRTSGLPLVRTAAAVALFVLGTATGLALRPNGAPDGRAVAQATDIDSPDEAARLVSRTEAAYLAALSRYAELTEPRTTAGDATARLAALESIVATTRAALSAAPADPVINGYHLTALAQREAMLQPVATTAAIDWF